MPSHINIHLPAHPAAPRDALRRSVQACEAVASLAKRTVLRRKRQEDALRSPTAQNNRSAPG